MGKLSAHYCGRHHAVFACVKHWSNSYAPQPIYAAPDQATVTQLILKLQLKEE